MLPKKFDELVEYKCSEIKRIVCKKSKEYATKTDRLHNFGLGKNPTIEAIEEKIGDAINYLILLEAICQWGSNLSL